MTDDLVDNFGIAREKCRIIYNPIDISRIEKLAREDVRHAWFQENIPIVISCGRLTTQKNYPFLFRALKLALQEVDIRLVILGQGEECEKIIAYAAELGISKQVAFLGFQENPFKYITRAAVFVLSSSWEGFAMVLLEAMACGAAVIATDCPFGSKEVINHNSNGILVTIDDEAALKNAIISVVGDRDLRERLASMGKIRAEDFKAETITKEYEKVFLEYV